MESPKKLVLDYSKWRCGGRELVTELGSNGVLNKNLLGKGFTMLLNTDGYMCCIGQFSLQCGAKESEILNNGAPCMLKMSIPFFTAPGPGKFSEVSKNLSYDNSRLSATLMNINDDETTTPIEKIAKIRTALSKYNIELEVINMPEN